MTKKEKFIECVEDALFSKIDLNELDPDIVAYWQALKGNSDDNKPMFTDNGKLILQFLRDNQSTPMWKAKDIAEGLFISSRGVSGAMRKLVTDGYVEKVGQDPVIYSITDNGKNIDIE